MPVPEGAEPAFAMKRRVASLVAELPVGQLPFLYHVHPLANEEPAPDHDGRYERHAEQRDASSRVVEPHENADGGEEDEGDDLGDR